MKLFLIRHGQTSANLNRIYAGQSDIPLTELGRQQAEALQPILADFQFDRVYSSDLSRAVDTQKLALPGVEGQQLKCLREYDVGSLAGQPFQGVKGYDIYGGETADMVCDRVRSFLKILEEDPCEYVAAFAHGGIVKCMLQVVLGVAYDRNSVIVDNCSIAVFEFKNGRWSLLAWNYGGSV